MEEIAYLNSRQIESMEKEHELRRPYEKPIIEPVTTMMFMFDAIRKQKDTKYVCRQCSSCHGCR